MHGSTLVLLLLVVEPIASQQIYDIWQTTSDQTNLFTSLAPSSPINFVTSEPTASADIIVSDSTKYQTIVGFGGTLSEFNSAPDTNHPNEFLADSSAFTLHNLKSTNSDNYWNVLQQLFSPVDGANAAGLSYLRVPIGASDFSAQSYSLDDVNGDTSFSSFNINNAPSYLFSVITDILSINSILKVHIVPWSPPGWMKDSGSMNGGSLKSNLVSVYPKYLLKAVQGFQSLGIPVFAISIQNEPQNSNPTYPTSTLTPATEGQIGAALRSLLNNNGLSGVKIIGYDHNWNNAGSYPVQLMQDDGAAFDGASFHCYSGSVANQDLFHSAFPSKNIYFTECSGTIGSDWWSDIKWYMDNLWIGSLEHNSQSGLMFNIALDANGNPMLPGTNSCGSGCRAIVTVNDDGSYAFNQECKSFTLIPYYALSQASKAILPKDDGGPWGQRIKVSVGGSLSWALRVGAYATGRASSSDWTRYALVVMNWYDNASSGGDPVPVTATIEFRGTQATYTFPVGVTTLWWYAPASGSALNSRTVRNDTTFVTNATDGHDETTKSIFARRGSASVAGRILM